MLTNNRVIKKLFIGLLLTGSYHGNSQIVVPQSPKFESFKSIGSDNSQPVSDSRPQYPSAPLATPPDEFHQPAHHFVRTAVAQKQREIEQLIGEIKVSQKVPFKHLSSTPDTIGNEKATRAFAPALQHLQDMLRGKAALSVADAYYTMESAYGNPYLTRKQFYDIIHQSAAFIKIWMQQNRLDQRDQYAVHNAIQKFMSGELSITIVTRHNEKGSTAKTITHRPFYYDYNDYQGGQDYRNFFVTKCLATGFGQCNSMPVVYLLLAEKLGVQAYLSFAPQHSFIKYPDNHGYILNYEPTSNWEISDKSYKDNMFISPRAVSSGIYLDTLGSRQIVANCIFDLAVGYMRVDRTLNDDFVLACLRAGNTYFPRHNNLQALFIYSVHLKTRLRGVLINHGITDIAQIDSDPEARALYQEYLGNEADIARLGYQDMPVGMYEALIKEHEFKGKVQNVRNINGKEKRNLFEEQ